MTQTEWIISLDDDLKDHDELFVGNVRDGDILTRCKDCKWFGDIGCAIGIADDTDKPSEKDYCSFAERKE